MRSQVGRGSSLGLIPLLAATLVAASLLGLAASQLTFLVFGGGGTDRFSPAPAERDAPSESVDASKVSRGEAPRLDIPEIERFVSEDVTTSYQPLPLPEAAGEVLAEYEAQGNCLLCESGYLDLQGNVWACVIQGDGWVEVQVVKSVDAGQGSELTVAHMEAESWAQELDGLMEGES